MARRVEDSLYELHRAALEYRRCVDTHQPRLAQNRCTETLKAAALVYARNYEEGQVNGHEQKPTPEGG